MKEITDIRAAVVGTGFIGVVHVDALRRLGVEITGVVGSTPERAAEKARTPGCPSPTRASRRCSPTRRVDVVHITSPNHLHLAQARAALEAGKHVVCEKPLAMTSAETAELLALAERSGLVHAVNFNIRFYPQCHEARGADRARARSATCGSSPAATSRTGCSSTPTGTGGWTRRRAARCARSATSARTGSTSCSTSPAGASRR